MLCYGAAGVLVFAVDLFDMWFIYFGGGLFEVFACCGFVVLLITCVAFVCVNSVVACVWFMYSWFGFVQVVSFVL